MIKANSISNKLSSFKLVLLYALISGIYIYASDYFLEIFTKDIGLLSKIQTYKGIGFILVTSILLYILVKRNLDITKAFYLNLINVKEESDIRLNKSKELYMALFNHSPLPKWIFDTETLEILLVNDVACKTYGYTREEFTQLTLRDIRPKEDIPLFEEIHNRVKLTDHVDVPNILRHKKKNGNIMFVKIKTSLIDYEGRLCKIASTIDITTEMLIQSNLEETSSKLHRASEIANLGYWTVDLVHDKVEWSDEVYKIFEISPVDFELNKNSAKYLFRPEDQVDFDNNFFESFDEKSMRDSEHLIKTEVGNEKWILLRQYLTKDNEAKPIRLDGIILDITKRKLHEHEIFESNERLKILSQATVEAIIDWDIKNDKVMWGEGFHTQFGYDLNVHHEHLWSENIHDEDREKVMCDMYKALEDPEKMKFNAGFRFLKANREITYVQLRGVFKRDLNGKATRALGAMIDITESLNRIRKIELQNKALADISYTQSHVVRAPLANLLGLIALLKDNYENGIDNTETICHIKSSAEKLDGIIKDIVSKSSEVSNNK